MKVKKPFFAILSAAAILFAGSLTAAAAEVKSPAEVTAGLTGRTVEDVVRERFDTGKTYGGIANEAGQLDAFQDAILEQRRTELEQTVNDGLLSQDDAGRILNALEQRQAYCNGAGYGAGFGCGYGRGCGRGYGRGYGRQGGFCPYFN